MPKYDEEFELGGVRGRWACEYKLAENEQKVLSDFLRYMKPLYPYAVEFAKKMCSLKPSLTRVVESPTPAVRVYSIWVDENCEIQFCVEVLWDTAAFLYRLVEEAPEPKPFLATVFFY